jgi:hypothetical protein
MCTPFPRLALFAAVLFALAGCDSDGIDVSPPPAGPPSTGGTGDGTTGGGGTGSSDGLFVPLSPRSTYLRMEQDPGALDPTTVALSDLGLSPGGTACFRAEGDYDRGSGVMASEGGVRVLAVFSRIKKTLDSTEPHRVPGAVQAGTPIVTPLTALGGHATDIDEDFNATDVCVLVPEEAQFVVLGAWDTYFSDNLPKGPAPFGVRILKKAP